MGTPRRPRFRRHFDKQRRQLDKQRRQLDKQRGSDEYDYAQSETGHGHWDQPHAHPFNPAWEREYQRSRITTHALAVVWVCCTFYLTTGSLLLAGVIDATVGVAASAGLSPLLGFAGWSLRFYHRGRDKTV